MRGQETSQRVDVQLREDGQRVPKDHPLRNVRALLMQILFTICSEHQLVEQLNYNLLGCGLGV